MKKIKSSILLFNPTFDVGRSSRIFKLPMTQYLCQVLSSIGYHHPLHTILAHLPICLIMGGVVFSLVAIWKDKPAFSRTAHHCMLLAFIFLLPTVILGVMDWQQLYGGAYLLTIKMKFLLVVVLIGVLSATVYWDIKTPLHLKTIKENCQGFLKITCFS